MDLNTPLEYVKGIGPARAAMLQAKGLLTVEDLLSYAPFRYEDRTNIKTIAQLAPGEMATVIAEVAHVKSQRIRGRMGLFEATFRDSSHSVLIGKWFNGDYLKSVLVPGLRLAVYGKIEIDSFRGELSILHPEIEILSGDDDSESAIHLGRIVPIHEAAGKVSARVLRTLLYRICESIGTLPDALPEEVRRRMKLPNYTTAVRNETSGES